MTDPFVAEIRMFAGNYAPSGWALCNGQLLPIAQNTMLYSLLGVTYGGDGRQTFALPDLTGLSPLQQGQGPGLTQRVLGETGGEAAVTLGEAETAAHTHLPGAVNAVGGNGDPTNAVWAEAAGGRALDNIYSTAAPDQSMNPTAIGFTGGGQPHNNLPPYLVVSFIIALQGIYPPRP